MNLVLVKYDYYILGFINSIGCMITILVFINCKIFVSMSQSVFLDWGAHSTWGNGGGGLIAVTWTLTKHSSMFVVLVEPILSGLSVRRSFGKLSSEIS